MHAILRDYWCCLFVFLQCLNLQLCAIWLLFTAFSIFLLLRISLSQLRSYRCCFLKQSKLIYFEGNFSFASRYHSLPWSNIHTSLGSLLSLFNNVAYLLWKRYFCSPFQEWTYFDASKTFSFLNKLFLKTFFVCLMIFCDYWCSIFRANSDVSFL